MSRARVEDDDDLDQQIEAQVNEWSSVGNECLVLQLVRGDGTASTFEPEFTYAMFGDEDAIFGYQGLEITLSFAAHNLTPSLDISYDKIFPAQQEVKPTDIREALRPFLPEGIVDREGPVSVKVEEGWTPPGEKIHKYNRNGHSYEVWCASLADPAAKQLLENMQIFAPLFIDGGSLLELDHDWTTARWKVFLLYEVDESVSKENSPYTLAGYGTSYRSFTFPERQESNSEKKDDVFSSSPQTIEDLLPQPSNESNALAQKPAPSTPLDLPSRERLSQFLILPTHQSAGHGQELYNTMYIHLTSPTNVREFTIEDPNEDFDQLRDVCDLLRLRRDDRFKQLKVSPERVSSDKLRMDSVIPTDDIVSIELRNSLNAQFKLQPRQFARLVEMQTLSNIPPLNRSKSRITKKERSTNEHDKAYFFWRLYAKERLYVFNRDQLTQIDASERVEKLDSALDSVVEGYLEILERVERIERERPFGTATEGAGNGKRKRRIVDEDDEEGEGADEEEDAEASTRKTGAKKPRVSS